MHLRATVAYSGLRLELFYWRTAAGREVDFVLYGSDGFYAVEAKSSPRVRSEDLSGLAAFGEEYPQSARLLLYRGEDRFVQKGILCVPVVEFLRDPTKVLREATVGPRDSK